MGSPWNKGESEDGEMPHTETFVPARPTVGLEASELELLRNAPDFDAEEMSTVRPPGGWPTTAPPPAAGFKPAAPVWSPPNRVELPGAGTAPGPEGEPRAAPTAPSISQPEPPVTGLSSTESPGTTSPAPWQPPNRVAPPAGAVSSGVRTQLPRIGAAGAGAGSEAARQRFPEERTVALLAEDLLGRPLDELPPAPDAAVLAAVLPVEQGMSWAPAQSAASSTSRSEPKRSASDVNVWDQAMPLVNEG